MLVQNIRHDDARKTGYTVDRPQGRKHYTFAHYSSPVTVKCGSITYKTQSGACILFAPDVPQYLLATEDLVHNWLHLDPAVEELTNRYQIPVNEPFYPHNSAMISELFRKIELEFYSSRLHREYLLDSYVNEFFIWLARAMSSVVLNHSIPHPLLDKMIAVREKILANPSHSWTLAEMAALVPLSPSRFHTIYKTIFGTTPARELIQWKVNSAKSLLSSENGITLAEAAEILGYHNQYHFIRQFKAVSGMTPGAFRKTSRR